MPKTKHLLLFDIDGTLTPAREKASLKVLEVLHKAKEYFDLAIVGGSDRPKQLEQVGEIVEVFNYSFSENGTCSYDEHGKIFHETSISEKLGEEVFQQLINYCLKEMSKINLPFKRGNFIEYRKGMINVSPPGRACNLNERGLFNEYNKQHHVLEKLAENIRNKFKDKGVFVSVGGQISMDVFPIGWDKTYCLQFVDEKYDEIHFFGDKCFQGGNDFEIFEHPRTIGHSISGPDDTAKEILKLVEKYSKQLN